MDGISEVKDRLPSLRRDFVRMCRKASVVTRAPGVDRSHGWVSLDRLWWEVGARGEFSKVAEEYIRYLIGDRDSKRVVIVTPDTISSSFGVTPVVFLAAHQLGVPVAVWQEIGDFASNKPILMGTPRNRLKCLVLQDVIRHGTTILKMLGALSSRRWDVITYACFVLNSQHKGLLERTRQKYEELTGHALDVQYLVTAGDLS